MIAKRILQLLRYGWMHAGQITHSEHKGFFYQTKVFSDILHCYRTYRMWSNQYLETKFWLLTETERQTAGQKFLEQGKLRDAWQKDFIENRRFLERYTSRKYERPLLREKRNKAYAKRYHMGAHCLVEYDVELSRQHYLPGTVSIGNNVLLAKHVFIDYSGQLVIKDRVKITNGVIIETHTHDLDAYNKGADIDIPTSLLIQENAFIGSRAIILPTCHYIGKNARIGAGAVVTKDIPDNALAAGVPAKIIKIQEI